MGLHARTARRAAALLAVAVFILGGLTACSPVRKGITGLTVDAAGRPLAALAWCSDRPPDVVLLFSVRASTSPTPSGRATPWPTWPGRRFTVPRAVTSPVTVPLDGFPTESGAALDAAYRMYGVADDSSFTTHGVDFRLGELTELASGSVLVTGIVDGEEAQETLSLEEFAQRGASEC